MMHRYRKGQTWRPPTAAESAAQADATEAHRRQPSQPQDQAPVGQHILVKTPVAEIAARDSDTIYWATCKRCIQRNTADEKEIVETDEELVVYNLQEQAVAGDSYVETALTECGTRYALRGTAELWRRYELKTSLAASGSATAYVVDPTGTPTSEEITVYDLLGAISGEIGDTGYCRWMTDSQKWEIVFPINCGS